MITIKTDHDLEVMSKGGKILDEVLNYLMGQIVPGVSLRELDSIAEAEIRKRGGESSFKRVKGYHWTICSCVNDVVVHGIPDGYKIREDDVVGIDCGVYYGGFHTDAAWTIQCHRGSMHNIESASRKNQISTDRSNQTGLFLDTGKRALKNAILCAREGNYIYDISDAIQNTVEGRGYAVVKSLVGHGVGRQLHEEPEIPGFVYRRREQTPRITKGMVLAMEVIYNMGTDKIIYKNNDGWTISTKDGTISGLFEATVAIGSHGTVVLAPESLLN